MLSPAVLCVVGVRADGYREYLRCWAGSAESTQASTAVFRDLSKRGLQGARHVVSDAHAGLKAAGQRHCPSCAPALCPSAAQAPATKCTACATRWLESPRPQGRRRSSHALGRIGGVHTRDGRAAARRTNRAPSRRAACGGYVVQRDAGRDPPLLRTVQGRGPPAAAHEQRARAREGAPYVRDPHLSLRG